MTGSVSGQATRLASEPKGWAQVMSGPRGRRRQPQPGSVGPWLQLVFATPTAAPLGVGDAACGYPAPSLKTGFQGAHEGVHQRGRVGGGGRNGESRAARELEDLAGAR
jgi:hypothetical protein